MKVEEAEVKLRSGKNEVVGSGLSEVISPSNISNEEKYEVNVVDYEKIDPSNCKSRSLASSSLELENMKSVENKGDLQIGKRSLCKCGKTIRLKRNEVEYVLEGIEFNQKEDDEKFFHFSLNVELSIH